MPAYKYSALDPSGQKRSGVMEGTSAIAVRNALLAQRLDVQKVDERKSWTQIEITRKKVKPADVMNFSRQLGAFLRAGVPILEALDALSQDMDNKQLKQILVDIQDSLRSGSSFAAAIGEHSDVFPAYYVGIIRSAELTGNLDVVLDQVSSIHRARPRDSQRGSFGAHLPGRRHGPRDRHGDHPRELCAPAVRDLLRQL